MTDTSNPTLANATASKTPMQSTTIVGTLISMGSGLVSAIGPAVLIQLGFSGPQETAIIAAIGALGVVWGGVMAIMGRMGATLPIKL